MFYKILYLACIWYYWIPKIIVKRPNQVNGANPFLNSSKH